MPVTLTSEAAECPVQLVNILLKPELSDVQFSVSSEKEAGLFHAHKLVLAVGSEVFKTMFFGSVPQPNPVVITDSTPAAFEAFLRFVYTGTTSIDDAEVFSLLNLAKKYFVGSLTTVVMNYLEECITSENIGEVVLNGQNFLDVAPLRFWESVECHAEALLMSDEFLHLRKDTVQVLLQRELDAEEMLVYEKAVSWAKAECTRNHDSVGGESLRTALEGIVQQIRFPVMSAEEFARGPASEAVLFAEEKVEVFKWFTAAIPQSIFPNAPRCAPDSGESYVCDRLTFYSNGWNGSGSTDAIDFTVDRAVRVTGIGVYGRSCGSGYFYTITATLLLGSAVLATKDLSGTTTSCAQPISVKFDKGIKIYANNCYTVSVVSNGPTYYGCNGNSSKAVTTKKGSVVFTFVQSSATSSTNVTQGQIPQILFRA